MTINELKKYLLKEILTHAELAKAEKAADGNLKLWHKGQVAAYKRILDKLIIYFSDGEVDALLREKCGEVCGQ